ncbi:MAG TPA: A/G-specific adenine glycosylase [Bryobacteraceae bacterium]
MQTPVATFSQPEIAQFRRALLSWFERHKRDLPWRRTRDPYAIWISEIMLQQTRVAAVIPFYQRFLARFPDIATLADAPEEDLLAHWAGLGYYHRARNLQKAAQHMRARDSFPHSHDEIRQLPGIGEYTSAAVASIAFDLPHAAVDGNVLRVLSRVRADPVDTASAKGRKHFARVADALLDTKQPGPFNQAMMELGATICLPKNPQCLLCPVSGVCRARQSGRENEFPVKLVSRKAVTEHRRLLWIERDGSILLWQRPAGARLMPGFWELPEREQLPEAVLSDKVGEFRHAITYHDYRCEVYRAEAPVDCAECRWTPLHTLPALPLSTLVRKARRLAGQPAKQAAGASRNSR